MTLDHRLNHLDRIRTSLSTLLTPLQYISDLPFNIAHQVGGHFTAQFELANTNKQLRQEQLEMSYKLQRLASLESENRHLRAMLQSSERRWGRVQVAEILAVDFDPLTRKIKIDKGSVSDITIGHPILDAYGVLGQIIEVSRYTSTAMLITDPSHSTPVEVNRTGVRTLALGTGAQDLLNLPHIPNNTDIVVGDQLLTSGLGGRFPAGYPIAEITEVSRRPTETYAQIAARPLAHLDRGRQVLVVWPQPQEATKP